MAPSRAVSGRRAGARRLADERGFSLVELSVVGAMLGLLMSIAVGTFTGAADKARDRAVESELRVALDAALLLALDGGGRFVVDDRPLGPADLREVEPVLAFADDGDRDVIGVEVSTDASTIRLDQLDDGGTRHTLVAVSGAGMRFCRGVEPADCTIVAVSSASTTTTTEVAPSNRAGGRQDGGTPAADRRQNGR